MSNSNHQPIPVKRLDAEAKLPVRSTENAAGYDLFALNDCVIPPGKQLLVSTGIALAIPHGWCGQIWPRSGWAVKKELDRRAGLFDSDYRGPAMILLRNESKQDLEIKKHDKIAQMVIIPHYTGAIEECDNLDETARGQGGFGSTGRT